MYMTTSQKPTTPTKHARRFTGTVVGNRMAKTVTVLVERTKIHRLYQKRYTVSTKYPVHDEQGQYRVGDVVEFVECRPISKRKRWRVVRKIK